MNISDIIIITVGLIVFEIISSIDNAVVNADVLLTMSQRGRHWFLRYGIFASVFLVRGLLPLLIIYLSNPSIGIVGAFLTTFSQDPYVKETIEMQKPILLAGGGVFLLFLFLHWLFEETKQYAFFLERHIHTHFSLWFYSLVSIVLVMFVWITIGRNPMIGLGAVIGSSAFFLTNGFKKNAAEKEQQLTTSHLSDFSKIVYLEIIDATFSIDGVLGAFAFTISIPLILIGNGIGAVVVRYITVHGAKMVRKYSYLKNGAMYSIGALGCIMMLESLGHELPMWLSPLITFVIVGIFIYLSMRELQIKGVIAQ